MRTDVEPCEGCVTFIPNVALNKSLIFPIIAKFESQSTQLRKYTAHRYILHEKIHQFSLNVNFLTRFVTAATVTPLAW